MARTAAELHTPILRWYAVNARPLPWRRPGCTPWGVLVSEVMSQQTPLSRVEPVWHEWLDRWPTPAALAAESLGEAIRAWGRLGYPRRALRLHEAARAIVDRFGGEVPELEEDLLGLPGVGAYTAAAVAAFAFGRRTTVLDTNVRRVLARVVAGEEFPARSPSVAERARARALLPRDRRRAVSWNVAVMELGALVCTARSPRCTECPIAGRCAWLLAGRPAYDGPARRGQAWEGTDRQVRGRIMAQLRAAAGPIGYAALTPLAEAGQLHRCIDGLVADGLLEPLSGRRFRLPIAAATSAGSSRRRTG